MKKALIVIGGVVLLAVLVNVYYSFRHYNVILITIDTLRPDYLSCYEPEADKTPNIDALAQRGVLFKNAFTLIPITLPSHVSILTSHQPYRLNVLNNGDHFDHKVPLVSDFFGKRGYQTAAFVSLGVLKGEFGLAQGFQKYEDDFSSPTLNGRYYKVASEVNDMVLPWIDKVHDKNFFAWIHYSDPHEPYIAADAPPDTEVIINKVPYKKFCIAKKEKILLNFMLQPGENIIQFNALVSGPKRIQETDSNRFIDKDIYMSPSDNVEQVYGSEWIPIKLTTGIDARIFGGTGVLKLINKTKDARQINVRFTGGVWNPRTEVIRDNYGKEVQFVDKNIGLLWDKLTQYGLQKNTIIIVTADHGEGLKTHGILGHVDRLWDETIRVPLIIYHPTMGYRGHVENQLVDLLDITPTILDFFHIRNKTPMEGQSLKYYITWSPLDRLFAHPVQRSQTFISTFAPEARVTSFAVTDLKNKVMHTPNRQFWKWEAYDLVGDPLERKNLAKWEPDVFEKLTTLRGLLEQHRKDAELWESEHKHPTLTEEQKEILRSLNYVTGSTPSQTQTQTLPVEEEGQD